MQWHFKNFLIGLGFMTGIVLWLMGLYFISEWNLWLCLPWVIITVAVLIGFCSDD